MESVLCTAKLGAPMWWHESLGGALFLQESWFRDGGRRTGTCQPGFTAAVEQPVSMLPRASASAREPGENCLHLWFLDPTESCSLLNVSLCPINPMVGCGGGGESLFLFSHLLKRRSSPSHHELIGSGADPVSQLSVSITRGLASAFLKSGASSGMSLLVL